MTQHGTKKSCTCEECQAQCSFKPGWFLSGEIEKVATFFTMSLHDIFRRYFAVDWWEDDEPTFVVSPAITTSPAGKEFPSDPRGICVFFVQGKCSIHAVKPFECKESLHNSDPGKRHEIVADAWKQHQTQIHELLGRSPRATIFWGSLL